VASTRRFYAVAALAVLGLAGAIVALIALAEPRALSVLEVWPGDGAADVPITIQITVTFSRPLEEASARAGVSLTPAIEGFVSVAGRRAAFTPRFGFRADTAYTLRLAPDIRDRGGRALAREIVTGFRTRPLGLVVRTPEGRLVRMRPGAEPEPVTQAPVEAFAVGLEGDLAYVRGDERTLVLVPASGGTPRRIALAADLVVRRLEWAPGGRSLLLLAGTGSGVGAPYIVRVEAASPAIEPFGPRAGEIDPASPLVTEVLKKSLVEIVYREDTFAVTPDGRAAIVRDQNWDFAVIDLGGRRLASIGPLLAVGNAAPGGDALAAVDVNPADPALRRQVLAYLKDGQTRALSAPEQDSHSPRFAHRSDRVVFATGAATGPPGARRYALEVADLATGARRRLTDPPAGQTDEAPRWSPDDAWVSFRRAPIGAPERGTVWLVPADGGPARPLPVAATDAGWML
jgi:hypothetical protein